MSSLEQGKPSREERIRHFLQRKDVIREIENNLAKVASETKVPIGNAVELFENKYKEPHLRYWEQIGLLHPERPPSGHRLYSLEELKKLAIIIVLLQEFAPSDIPANVIDIWNSFEKFPSEVDKIKSSKKAVSFPIEKLINASQRQLFDRFFISRILHLTLSLIGEDISSIVAGIILPKEKPSTTLQINSPDDLHELGECLVGWFDEKKTFYTLLQVPAFEFPSDYRIEPIGSSIQGTNQEERTAWVILERKAVLLDLNNEKLEVVQRLLKFIYNDSPNWQSLFGTNMHAGTELGSNFTSMPHLSDIILSGIGNKVVDLGGKNAAGHLRWRFCCILLPKDINASLLQQSLVVKAGSILSPHKPHATIISPGGTFTALSLRAFQNGHIAYRHDISIEDSTIELRQQEGNIRSAIAIPVGNQENNPVAVLYVVSDEPDNFTTSDQCLLQIVCRIIEEHVRTYNAHYQSYENLSTIFERQEMTDNVFKKFYTEEDFISDVENFLGNMHNAFVGREAYVSLDASGVVNPEAVISFIGLDINDQGTIAKRYGDRLARNLSLQMGQRIKGHLLAVFRRTEDWQLYHIYADRFYLMLQGIPIQRARAEAEKLRTILKGSYKVDALRTMTEVASLPDWLVEVSNITVRLAVTSYPHNKLYDMLQKQRLRDVTANILRSLDGGLKRGKDDDETYGDVVYSWDSESGDFIRITSARNT